MVKIDKLVESALVLCNKEEHSKVSPALFQRCLNTDFYSATKVFNELVNLKVIGEVKKNTYDDEGDNPLGTIDKLKLKEFFLN